MLVGSALPFVHRRQGLQSLLTPTVDLSRCGPRRRRRQQPGLAGGAAGKAQDAGTVDPTVPDSALVMGPGTGESVGGGIEWLAVPTTLLAMVDAAIGGKTGIDHRAGKNLLGTFWPPKALFADPEMLATLDRRQLRAGLAEDHEGMVFHAVLHQGALARLACAHDHHDREDGQGALEGAGGEPGKRRPGRLRDRAPVGKRVAIIGAGGIDVAVAMGGGNFYLKAPKVYRVNLTGELKPWVTAKETPSARYPCANNTSPIRGKRGQGSPWMIRRCSG